MYSAAFEPFCHSHLTSSKPSAFSGMENFVKDELKLYDVMSGVLFLAYHTFFSSSVSLTFGGSSSFSTGSATSSSSSSSSSSTSIFSSSFGGSSPLAAASFAFFSASAFFASSACFFFSSFSFFFFAFSASFCCFARSFCLFSLNCWALNSASEKACFCCSMKALVAFLKSAEGSPNMTCATLLKDAGNLATNSALASLIKFVFTSMIRKFRLCSGAME
mmetsp:Transcript_114958/g.256668  ORF Transcript_114958/g.256668 Transcript_114958/m.256668 type:complete len:219 (-) Transcript_114958:1117-1773(-)